MNSFSRLCAQMCMISFFVLATSTTVVAGNAEAGKEKSVACQGCHGADGNSYGPDWPNLAAQHAGYIRKQIKNFQAGERKDPTMSSMVVGLSDEDIADIAAYFSSQTLQASTSETDDNLLSTGKKIYKGGNVYNNVPACAGCHGPTGSGSAPANFPNLAGQKITYLTKQLNDFKAGTRQNDPRSIMQNIASRMSDNEIKSVATYISQLSSATQDEKTNKQ